MVLWALILKQSGAPWEAVWGTGQWDRSRPEAETTRFGRATGGRRRLPRRPSSVSGPFQFRAHIT